MAGAVCGVTGSGTRIYPYCLYWHFGNQFSLDVYLVSLGIVGRQRQVDLCESKASLVYKNYFQDS